MQEQSLKLLGLYDRCRWDLIVFI